MPVEPTSLSSRLTSLRERVDRAAQKSGRVASDITLVAVTKTVSASRIREAGNLGVAHFGESRIQEASAKRIELDGLQAVWHMIGHLQTNKVRKALDLFTSIQTVDSERLAEILHREAEKDRRTLSCLLEVKTSSEESKHGLMPESIDGFLDRLDRWPRLRFQGLMTVAPYDERSARPCFSRLREMAWKRRDVFGPSPVLSMGMSHDFEAAIEEGSTMIRIGTALFGDRA